MKISPDTKSFITKNELLLLEELCENKKLTENNVLYESLLEKFNTHTLETLLRKADFYEIVKIKDNTFKNDIYKTAAKQSKKICHYREQLLSIGFTCPENLSNFFFDIFKLKMVDDERYIKIQADKVRNAKETQEYFKDIESFINELESKENESLKSLLNSCLAQKLDKEIALEMSTRLKNRVAGVACHIRNYIDDHCPIYITEPLNQSESKLLEFLSENGDIVDYTLAQDTDICNVFETLETLKRKFSTNSTEELITLNLIESYYRKDNLNYINLLLNININLSTKNIETLGNLVAPQKKFKILQMKKNLENLKVEIPENFKGAQYKRLCNIMTIKKLIKC